MAERGRADPISIDAEFPRERAEYLPEEDAVRYLAGLVVTNKSEFREGAEPKREPNYRTVLFDLCASTECAHMGAGRVLETAKERLGMDDSGGEVSYLVSSDDNGRRIALVCYTTLGRDGSVVSDSTVDHDELVSVTPRSVTSTISLDGRSRTETIPVWVEWRTVQLEQ